MKRLLPLLALSLCLLLTAFREPEKPNMEQIREEVTNPSSPYYYPKLMERYERQETLMTLDDYRRLYLGYVFQEDFNPYRMSPYAGEVENLYYKSKHSKLESRKIEEKARLSLNDDPFNLQQIDYLIYAYRELGKKQPGQPLAIPPQPPAGSHCQHRHRPGPRTRLVRYFAATRIFPAQPPGACCKVV